MNILLLNTSERTGGAAVAASRCMAALQKAGVGCRMLVRDKHTNNPDVLSVNDSFISRKINFIRFAWERLILFLCNHFNRPDLFRVSMANTGNDISRMPVVKEADIIHIHWINQGFLSLSDLEALAGLGKPIVWTMHDMWACTGICHHARACEKYKIQCGTCLFLNSRKERDLSTKIFLKKKNLYKRANLTFVGCSQWLAGLAKQSALCAGKEICSISNPINTSVFHPLDKSKCRSELGLPLNKKLLLFGALNVTDKRKGVDYLIDALRLMDTSNIELVVFGQIKADMNELLPLPIHSMGYLCDEGKITMLYNAVDVFVTSSLEENLPNTIMESMACGTPCVGFHIGGIPEMIDHRLNGYVAKYKDSDDLAKGIQWVLENSDELNLSNASIRKVHDNYTEAIVAEKYISLYNRLLQQNIK